MTTSLRRANETLIRVKRRVIATTNAVRHATDTIRQAPLDPETILVEAFRMVFGLFIIFIFVAGIILDALTGNGPQPSVPAADEPVLVVFDPASRAEYSYVYAGPTVFRYDPTTAVSCCSALT